MTLLKVARLGNPVLRRPAEPVSDAELHSPGFARFLEDLVETMHDSDGVGIAGPQVHISRRVFVVEVKSANSRYPGQANVPLTVIVNPVIEQHAPETETDWEGCLSIPDLRGRVPRWISLVLTGQDPQGTPLRIEADRFFARVIQHELDHLDGILFLDRMTDLSSLTYLREFGKYWQFASERPELENPEKLSSKQ